MPIDMLAYCCQFSVLDVANEIPASLRMQMPWVVHSSMAAAAAVYVAFAAAGYLLLGESAIV